MAPLAWDILCRSMAIYFRDCASLGDHINDVKEPPMMKGSLAVTTSSANAERMAWQ